MTCACALEARVYSNEGQRVGRRKGDGKRNREHVYKANGLSADSTRYCRQFSRLRLLGRRGRASLSSACFCGSKRCPSELVGRVLRAASESRFLRAFFSHSQLQSPLPFRSNTIKYSLRSVPDHPCLESFRDDYRRTLRWRMTLCFRGFRPGQS